MACGIDLGSRNIKLAKVDHGEVIELNQWDTSTFYRQFGRLSGGKLSFNPTSLVGDEATAATGYGRITVTGIRVMTELKAHVQGALFQTKLRDFTLLDLGGQDTKVILVRDGIMMDFLTNDKCAASSGRYLENMANVLGIGLDELSQYWQEPTELTATCAVFGESEIIGKTVEGCSVEHLAAGVNFALFKRVEPLLHRFKSDILVFVGGVAKNGAFRCILEDNTSFEVIIPPFPIHNAAIGCACSLDNSVVKR